MYIAVCIEFLGVHSGNIYIYIYIYTHTHTYIYIYIYIYTFILPLGTAKIICITAVYINNSQYRTVQNLYPAVFSINYRVYPAVFSEYFIIIKISIHGLYHNKMYAVIPNKGYYFKCIYSENYMITQMRMK